MDPAAFLKGFTIKGATVEIVSTVAEDSLTEVRATLSFNVPGLGWRTIW
jgi:hypothetical protein